MVRQFTDEDLVEIRAHFPLEECLSPPDLFVSAEAAAAFDQLFESTLAHGPAGRVDYTLPYPKYLFLEYLAQTRGVMLHGSTLSDLEELQPVRRSRDAREFGDQAAIYATQDPLWGLFFAVLDREILRGLIMNGAIQLRGEDGSLLRRYYYCLDADSVRQGPWKDGMVYLLPGDGFEADPDLDGVRVGSYELICTHWIRRSPVIPLARLPVEPGDFPYVDRVWGYDGKVLESRFSAGSIAGWPFLSDAKLYPIRPGP